MSVLFLLSSVQDTLMDLLLPPQFKSDPPKLEIKKDPKGMVTVQGATIVEVWPCDHEYSRVRGVEELIVIMYVEKLKSLFALYMVPGYLGETR
jgi:hypothetical protein